MTAVSERLLNGDDVLASARKLLALAGEQLEALQRGANAQFDWLCLRRDEVTGGLQQAAQAGVQVEPAAAGEIELLRGSLARTDAAIEACIRGRMSKLRRASNSVKRFRQQVSPYLASGPRAASFVDRAG